MKAYIFFAVLVWLNISSEIVSAQSCNNCSVSITTYTDTLSVRIIGVDTSNYVLGVGQTMCIYGTGLYKGSLTVSGGTVCNRGKFLPKTIAFNSGLISNSGSCAIKSGLNIATGGSIVNFPKATINISGSLTSAGGSILNEGIINVSQNIQNNTGLFVNKSIINCAHYSGSNQLITDGSGILNSN